MSSIPRVSSAIPGEPAHFASVLAHQPILSARFAALYGSFWDSDVLPARIKEIVRMRNARVTQCGFCRNVRFDKALNAGLCEATIDDITDEYADSGRLDTAEKAALKFADALVHKPEALDDEARSAICDHFSPAQIAEMALGATLFLALAKVLITLGLEPEDMTRTVLPTPAAPPHPAMADAR
jgi:alkylhydroperoxidase family enzyme